MKNEGDRVTIKGVPYTLGKRIGGGLEGSVFDIDGGPNANGYVVKIINDSKIDLDEKIRIHNQIRKLAYIRSTNGDLRNIMTLPIEILDSDLGYVMRKAENYESLEVYNHCPKDDSFEEWYRKDYGLKRRYQILLRLFEALRKIHLNGLIFTDLSPHNIMVPKDKGKDGLVFIDTDNLRDSRQYTAVLGTPRYIAPEIYRANLPREIGGKEVNPDILSKYGKATINSDIFSAAVIAFELLLLQHPFIGDCIDEGTPEDEERALRIETDYIFKDGTTNISTRGLTTRCADVVSPEIMRLFERTFVDGAGNPNLRPTDEEFISAFQKGLDSLITCPKCGFDHMYVPGLGNHCINCEYGFGEQVALITYVQFANVTDLEALNTILGNDYALDSCKPFGSKCILSRVVLEPGVPKNLYLRHFEEVTDRSDKYAIVTLNGTDAIELKINFKKFEKVEVYKGDRLRDTYTQGIVSLKTYHTLVLQRVAHGNGTSMLCLGFERC